MVKKIGAGCTWWHSASREWGTRGRRALERMGWNWAGWSDDDKLMMM